MFSRETAPPHRDAVSRNAVLHFAQCKLGFSFARGYEKSQIPPVYRLKTFEREEKGHSIFGVGSCKSVLDFLFLFTITFFGFFDGVNHGKIV